MALHRQLFLVLREQINRGAFEVGQALPTEQALCEQFGVSRITVRRALQDLSDQGLVERRHGRGTYVLARGGPTDPPPPVLSDKDVVRKVQLETRAEIVDVALRSPPVSVALALTLEEGSGALYVLRVRKDKTSGQPLLISEAWLPPQYADLVTRKSLKTRALHEIMSEGGFEMGRVAQELTAEIADPTKARLLDVSIGSALIRINRLIYDVEESPAQHLTLYLTPERSRILMDVSADRVDTTQSGFISHDVHRGRIEH